jgi:sterol desaturase/sphingolipid hydroxylase (fatty acid hydroxylase superfamily)
LSCVSHRIDHTATKLNTLAAHRASPTNVFSLFWLFYFAIPLLGFSFPAMAAGVMVVANYQLWIHTDVVPKLGWLESIFNTPAHHRLHHAINEEYHDCNYGGILIIFERIFGTYRSEIQGIKITYGATDAPDSQKLPPLIFANWIYLARDLKKYSGLKNRLRLIFGRPGWLPTPPEASVEFAKNESA